MSFSSATGRLRALGRRRGLDAIERIFLDSEARHNQNLPFRVTARGYWVPMPFAVLVALVRAMQAHGAFEPSMVGRTTVVDAGTGDGRVLAALAYLEPTLAVVGVESDEGLFHRAVANLETLTENALVTRPERLRLLRGDYRRAATYESSEVRLQDVGFVFNYPDGNQDALEQFVIESIPPGVKLCLLTHDGDLRLSNLALTSKDQIFASAWHWSVYSS